MRIVVAGGGIAGIATALRLADRGHGVVLLERRPFLGGRVYSFHDSRLGRELDNGQHAMLGCYEHTLALLARIGSANRLHWQGLRMEMRESGRRATLSTGRTPAPAHLVRALFGYGLLSRSDRLRAAIGASRLLRRWRSDPERLAAETVSEALAGVGQSEAAVRRLWTPIAVAALNASPTEASAALFAAVISRAFFGRARDAAIVLPAAPLSDVFGRPGEHALREARVDVRTRASLACIELDAEGRVRAGVLRDRSRLPCDAVVLALPPWAISGVWIGHRTAREALGRWVDELGAGIPIVSTHLSVEGGLALPEMIGLIGTTTQWVFATDRFVARRVEAGPSVLSCVTSDAAGLDVLDDAEVARRTIDEVRRLVPEAGAIDPERSRVVRERNATIPATRAATSVRPEPTTGVSGLFLAGDWVRTGLPATIESAAASAKLAGDAVDAWAARLVASRRVPGERAA